MSYGFNEDKSKYAINLDSIASEIIVSIRDQLYPIGSIYMSMADNFNPGDVFGGEWTEISGKFLLAAGQDQHAGDTGGTTGSIKLNSNQCAVPPHTHNNNIAFADNGHVHQEANAIITGHGANQTKIDGNPIKTYLAAQQYAGQGTMAIYNSNRRVGNTTTKDILKTGTGKASLKKSGGVQNTGSGIGTTAAPTNAASAVNIMPPYVKVHVWQRIA